MIPATLKPELAPASSLMDRVLRDGDAIAPEYPLVFREGFPGRVVALSDDQEVRSACTVLDRELVCPDARIPIGMIGSVSTDPRFRRQGLATKILDQAEQGLATAGAAAVFLWADDSRFYFARGYRPVGAEEDFAITRELAALLPELDGVREATDADVDAIHALYAAKTARVERTASETGALLQCPGMTSLVREHDGQVVAYACLGRGRDMAGTVHEWGGDVDSVLALVREHAVEAEVQHGAEAVFLIAPLTEEELCGRLQALGAAHSRGVLGLAKIANRGVAAALLGELMGEGARVTFDPDAASAEQVHLRTERGEAYLNDDTLLVLLFSTRDEREDIQGFGEHFGVDVSRLPVQPFVWGLDSI